MKEIQKQQPDRSLSTARYFEHDPDWRKEDRMAPPIVDAYVYAYAACVQELLAYLQPLWQRSRRSLKRFIHKLLRPFRRQGDALRLIAGASVKLLFIACLLGTGSAQAQALDPKLSATLATMMQVEAVSLQRELVVFDPSVPQLPLLLAGFNRNVEYLVLDPTRDGVAQIAAAMQASTRPIGALHLVAHGAPGSITLGGTVLDAAALNTHRETLGRISRQLTGNKDILLYGCRSGEGPTGEQFIDRLRTLTGADIAASSNLTGAAHLGGDWRLEIVAGQLETPAPFVAAALEEYQHVLATLTVTSNADSGAGTLRQAIADATAGDRITFDAGMAITLSSGQLTLAKNLTIDGDLDNDGTSDVTISGSNLSRVMMVNSGVTAVLDSLALTAGNVTGANGSNAGNQPVNTGGTGAAGMPGGAGENALGGCLFNAGTLTLLHGSLASCSAIGGAGGTGGGGGGGGAYRWPNWSADPGGAGGTGGAWGNASGGALYNAGTLHTHSDDTLAFDGNSVTGGLGGYGGGGGGGGDGYYGSNGASGNGQTGGNGGSGGHFATDSGGRGGDGGTAGSPGAAGGASGGCNIWGYCGAPGGNGGSGGASGVSASADLFNAGIVNLLPDLLLTSSSLSYATNDAATPLDGSAGVSDSDGDSDWNGGTLTIRITANSELTDELSIPDNVVGTINTNGTELRNDVTVIGTLSTAEGTVPGGSALTITFNGNATNALVQQTLRAIHYRNTSATPGTLDRMVSVTAKDRNAGSALATRTIKVLIPTTTELLSGTNPATYGAKVILLGKPPALPGDSNSLTVPGI